MKLLEKEEIVTQAPEASAPRYVEKTDIAVRARVATRAAKRQASPFNDFCARTVLFACLVGGTYVASTLGGYVVLERARQSARHGSERAAYARGQAKEARESIEALTNPTALRAWADERGFVAGSRPDEVKDARVAQR